MQGNSGKLHFESGKMQSPPKCNRKGYRYGTYGKRRIYDISGKRKTQRLIKNAAFRCGEI
jgi:hypothetical protein